MGSEMCIRDSPLTLALPSPLEPEEAPSICSLVGMHALCELTVARGVMCCGQVQCLREALAQGNKGLGLGIEVGAAATNDPHP